jgi:hypothetical protein
VFAARTPVVVSLIAESSRVQPTANHVVPASGLTSKTAFTPA